MGSRLLGLASSGLILPALRRGDTPERLADAVRGLPPEVLRRRHDGKWSIQENAGHLFDLESLWDQRLDDYDAGATELHPADLENRKTHEAGHNDRPIADILADFSAARRRIVERLTRMGPTQLARTALHRDCASRCLSSISASSLLSTTTTTSARSKSSNPPSPRHSLGEGGPFRIPESGPA